MSRQAELIEQGRKYLSKNYRQLPVVFVKGEGTHLIDADGKRYLDFVGGIAVCALGHAPPKIAQVLAQQGATLLHVSNLYFNEPQIRLAQLLAENSFADRVFFCNSGAEANEAAVKLARRYQREVRGEERYEILCAEGSFHGRTLAMIAATGQEKYRQGFGPMPPGFRHVPYGDLSALQQAIDERTAAVMIEPIQGEAGVVVPPDGYLSGVRNLCDEAGVLLILDEVQTGLGRTGKLFAHEQEGITPDIMTLAKALGAGFPIGAMLSTEEVAGGFAPGTHASTFGGNALAAAVAKAAFETISDPAFLARVQAAGARLEAGLESLRTRFPFARGHRGRGLLRGLVIEVDGGKVVERCLGRGLLLNHIGGKVLRFAPPLTVSDAEIDEAMKILGDVFAEMPA
jgi:predicted acetylornithine/succinylornithine family transaminase